MYIIFSSGCRSATAHLSYSIILCLCIPVYAQAFKVTNNLDIHWSSEVPGDEYCTLMKKNQRCLRRHFLLACWCSTCCARSRAPTLPVLASSYFYDICFCLCVYPIFSAGCRILEIHNNSLFMPLIFGNIREPFLKL